MSQDVQTYDLIIVGAGSGNMIPVPEMENWRLAIVEPDKFGGTCLNRGCIPSKMLLYPAEVVETAQHAAKLGVHHTLARVDWQHIVAPTGNLSPTSRSTINRPSLLNRECCKPAHTASRPIVLYWAQGPGQWYRSSPVWTACRTTPLTP